MSLPKLPNFNDDIEKIKINEDIKIKKELKQENSSEINQVKSRPRIPKSTYDENGKPILAIPNLDDVNLTYEIEKYFGKEVK